jgi:hypothetical protein
MAAIQPMLEPQWAYVATTLTTLELRALESRSPSSELPQALAYRRAQREHMLQRETPRFLRLVETKKAVPIETKRADRIRRLQQLYGFSTFDHAAPHARFSPDTSSRPRTANVRAQSQASSAFPTEHEEDALLEWTEQLDPAFLSGSGSSLPFGSSSLFDSSATHPGATFTIDVGALNVAPHGGQPSSGAHGSSILHLELPRTPERLLLSTRADAPVSTSSVDAMPLVANDVDDDSFEADRRPDVGNVDVEVDSDASDAS